MATDEQLFTDQMQKWLMRHGQHWNDGRASTEDACYEADHAAALLENQDRAVRELKRVLRCTGFSAVAERAEMNKAERMVLRAGLEPVNEHYLFADLGEATRINDAVDNRNDLWRRERAAILAAGK